MPSPGPGIHSRPTTPHSGNTRSSWRRCGQPSPRHAAPRRSLRSQVRAASPRHGCEDAPRSPHTRKPLAGIPQRPGAVTLSPFLRHSRHCDHERAARGTAPAPGPRPASGLGLKMSHDLRYRSLGELRPLPGSRTGPLPGCRLRRGAPPGPGPRRTSRRRTTDRGWTGPTPRD